MNDASTENPIATNPGGESPPGVLPEPSARTLAAGEQAINQHAAESGKPVRAQGRPIIHGRYAGRKRKRRGVPVEKVDNGSAPPLLEETLPLAAEIGTEATEPLFNEEINRKYAELIVGLLGSISNARKKAKIIKQTANKELADWVISKKTMPPAPKEAMEVGLVEIARKYSVDLSHSPEAMFVGGLLLWQAEDAANTTALIAEYHKLRPPEVKLAN